MSTGVFYEDKDGARKEHTVESLAALGQDSPAQILANKREQKRLQIKGIYQSKVATIIDVDQAIGLLTRAALINNKLARGKPLTPPDAAKLAQMEVAAQKIADWQDYAESLTSAVQGAADPDTVDIETGWPV